MNCIEGERENESKNNFSAYLERRSRIHEKKECKHESSEEQNEKQLTTK